MKLQTKIFLPIILSLVLLGGSMYLLNRRILVETFEAEMKKVLSSKEKSVTEILASKESFLAHYSNTLANSYAIRAAFTVYNQTQKIDTSWSLINSEIDRIKFGANQSKIEVPPINCYAHPGIVLFRSRSSEKGDNVLQKRKAIQKIFEDKKSIQGLEVGKYGIDIRGISPVIVRGQFIGALEVNSPFIELIKELKPSDYESYALIISKEYVNMMSKVEGAQVASNFIQEDLIVFSTSNFNRENFNKIYQSENKNKRIEFDKINNYLQIPITSFDNEVLGVLVYQNSKKDFITNMNASSYSLFFIGIMIFLLAIVTLFIVIRMFIIIPIKRVTRNLNDLSNGKISDSKSIQSNDEVGEMQNTLITVSDGLKKMAHFTIEIGNENYNSTFEALSEDDLLGNTLLQVRDKLKNVAEEMQHQAKLEEQRKWMVEGNAKFVAILQDNEMDIESYTYNILSNLISYLDVNQGAFFLLAKDKETLFLKSAYAYDRRKFLNKEIKVGDGLLGNTALEGKMTYLTDLPQNYISITSGLGEAPPSALLMLPLISENELYGVLELASFRTFEPFELEFCEKIAQNIAQAIGRQQINQQTKELLEQSRQQAEELSAQEEEMRQNLEEMQATQEEMARKESELTGVVNALNVSSLVAEFDLYGNILTVNKKIIDLFGLKSKDEIIGANHRDFYINVDDEVQNDRIWSELENGQIIARKGQIRTPKGDVIWLNETYTPVYDAHQRVSKVLNISFDITEEVMSQQQISQQHEEMQAQEEEMRQNMEEMLATQEEMGKKEAELVSLTSAIDAAALVVYFNLEGEVLNVNDKVLESFGIADRSTIIGLNHRDFYHSEDYEAELGAIWSKLKDKEVVSRLATVHLNNGDSILLNETYSPILDEYGSIDRILNLSFIQS